MPLFEVTKMLILSFTINGCTFPR